MKKRIKLLQEYACLLRCRGCGALLIAKVQSKPRGWGGLWQAALDSDLRDPRPAGPELPEATAELLCEECVSAHPLRYNDLTDEELLQLEHLVGKLLGDESQDKPERNPEPEESAEDSNLKTRVILRRMMEGPEELPAADPQNE